MTDNIQITIAADASQVRSGADEAIAALAGVGIAAKNLDASTRSAGGTLAQFTAGLRTAAAAALQAAEAERQTLNANAASLAEIGRQDLDADLQILKLRLQAKKDELQAEVEAGKISRTQELQQLRDLVQQEGEADVARLQAEVANGALTVVEQNRVTDQIRIAWVKLQTDLSAIDLQIAAASRQAAQQDASAWTTARNEILRSEDTLVQGILSGRETLGAALERAAWGFVEREIEADLHYLTMRMLFDKEELTSKAASDQGGLLVHLMTEQEKTAATSAGATARAAAETAAASTGTAVQAAIGGASIMNDAKQAAAGAYAATAQIPVIGPVLAPAAAAAAFTAVAAFDTLTSAEGGAWNVPGGLYMLHPQESVLPASIAQPMRDFFQGEEAGSGDRYNITINAVDAAGVRQLFMQNGSALVSALAQQKRNLNSSLGRLLLDR